MGRCLRDCKSQARESLTSDKFLSMPEVKGQTRAGQCGLRAAEDVGKKEGWKNLALFLMSHNFAATAHCQSERLAVGVRAEPFGQCSGYFNTI